MMLYISMKFHENILKGFQVIERTQNVCLFVVRFFVLRFYGPVNPMGSCRAQSVYLTTCLQGRLNPLSG